ncbi:MAG: hypothetical protein ACX93U_09965 [Salipiger thiooxidans]|jgi:hypothetical protein|uniref:Uncharacterized protein n=1 Tax=Salipiger thiooxidans TaxID=282683 RepID=A0A1G7EVS5_9RHOB|nr:MULTISPECIES: hypothetical protein [Salipiger]MAU46447.1 hypothetical protein [Salipiger sp.]NVK59358.1 hypothetical protein [Paracoccaceae bacterium]MBN8187026.1 hypothetical protein [Salipiger thiooxidans]MCA0846652.1 hypothetical protein [Salipiger thiooxidans]NIY96758.1 hypothetical protein [Salipiger sp. HF18]
MSGTPLPSGTSDVLAMPASKIPEAIDALVKRRKFSGLVSRIHRDLNSADPARRSMGALALKRLGFPE